MSKHKQRACKVCGKSFVCDKNGRVLCEVCRQRTQYHRRISWLERTSGKCEMCGRTLRSQSAKLCQSCYRKYRLPRLPKGESNPSWRGGIAHTDGYVGIKVDSDDFFYSMANGNGYIPEHRLVMAKYLNRCLLPWEVVHHRNGVRDDNRLENLELISDKRYHMIDANTKGYIKRLEKRIAKLEQARSG